MSTQFIDTSHGVLYTPESVEEWRGLSIDNLKAKGIKFIRVLWVDLVNSVRLRVLPISYFEKLVQSPRPGLGVAKVALGLIYLSAAEGFSSVGEYLYVPDSSSARICPYAPGHASVLGWFEEKAPYLGADGELTVKAALCPRTNLNNIVQEAKASKIEFLVGFEIEFVILKSTSPVVASSNSDWAHGKGLLTGMIESQILEEIVDALVESGVQVEIYHPEAAPGQYEIVTGPLSPLAAADALIHTRETITHAVKKHGYHASFAPRIAMTSAGNGAHTHISVHAPGHEKPVNGLSELESSFLAGVLDNLTSLPAITLPIPASYKRVGDGLWSGGTYVAWGSENRECPIRLSNASSPKSRNFEMRFIDGTASPYLVLASILAAGFVGIKAKSQLTIKNSDGDVSPAQMTEEERKAMGIVKRMPLSWEESRNNLAQNETLRKALGDEFIDKYLAVNKHLGDCLALDGDDELKTLTRLVEFY